MADKINKKRYLALVANGACLLNLGLPGSICWATPLEQDIAPPPLSVAQVNFVDGLDWIASPPPPTGSTLVPFLVEQAPERTEKSRGFQIPEPAGLSWAAGILALAWAARKRVQ